MNEWIEIVFAGLETKAAIGLLSASFVASFITVALGIGGGVLLLSIMASLLPAAALIPVHGVIQLGSNLTRATMLLRHVYWKPVTIFIVGSIIGVLFGGAVAVDLPAPIIQIGIGCFVIWNVIFTPPKWLATQAFLNGGIASFLTMFFGATGVFVANFTKSLSLERQSHVATHAVLMTVQHALKVLAFGMLGFAFGQWILFILAMTISGAMGTVLGRLLLIRMNDKLFKRALDVVLILISLRLIWSGFVS